MDRDLRSALLGLGIAFCVVFGGLTLYAAVKLGVGLRTYGDLLGLLFLLISFGVIAMIGVGLYGAIQSPPSGGPAPPVWPEEDREDDD